MNSRDIRFNQTSKHLYVTPLGWPEEGKVRVRALAKGNPYIRKNITKVELLGYGYIKAKQTTEGLEVTLPKPTNDIAPVLKIKL